MILFAVCHNGNVEVARLLIKFGASVNLASEAGCTPLMLAAQHGRIEVTQLLLDSGALSDSENNEGCSALAYAAQNNFVPIVELLLEKGAAVEGPQGVAALAAACQLGHGMLFKYFSTVARGQKIWTAAALAP